ncbi:MAG: hypothetical protein WD069_13570 [Planctomycetales bacterium]
MRSFLWAACLAVAGCTASGGQAHHSGCGAGPECCPPGSSDSGSSGCLPRHHPSCGRYSSCLDDCAVRLAAKRCARRHIGALEERAGCRYSDDFEDGHRQGWIDVSRGLSGATPAIPPQKYWKAENRTPRGHARAREWFAGYEAGAAEAQQHGLHEFRRIPSSVAAAHFVPLGPRGPVLIPADVSADRLWMEPAAQPTSIPDGASPLGR